MVCLRNIRVDTLHKGDTEDDDDDDDDDDDNNNNHHNLFFVSVELCFCSNVNKLHSFFIMCGLKFMPSIYAPTRKCY